MKSDRWQQLEDLFGQALDLEGEARRSFLDTACGDDADLRQQLEELLAEDTATDTFLDETLVPPLHSLPEPPVPETIGPYRLRERLGAGGMGVVYRAERSDGEFDRDVAVKLLRRGLSPEAVQRFRLERRILANLDHPHIARLLDSGTTAEGIPFVLIEKVDGEPVDSWCMARALDVRARLDILLRICDAVSVAHRNLVVHCDLKPSNILITADGSPKLLDFGIASLLDADSASVEGPLRMLTPSYASPEQLRGERITVATDVYLLGLVLYKLLSGRLPHRVEGQTRSEASRIVLEESPPSIRSLDEALAIDGELDAIVLRALEAAPQDRYASVDDLAADLRRYLDGLPVSAYSKSWSYRTGKFLRRRWLASATVALAFATTTVFGFYWQDQARALEHALERSRLGEQFLREIVWAVDPAFAGAKEISVRSWLETGARKLDLLDGQPELEASLRALFGHILVGVDAPGAAREQLEKARQLFAQSLEKTTPLRHDALRALSDLAVASFLTAKSDAEAQAEAEAMARTAVTEARQQFQNQPSELAGVLSNLSLIYCWQGKSVEARPLADEILSLSQSFGIRNSLLATALSQQALVLKNVDNDLEGSMQLYREALDMMIELEGETHPEIATLYNQLGFVALQLDDPALSIEYQEKSLAVRRTLYEPGSREIAMGLANLATAYHKIGRFGDAETTFHDAIEVHHNHPDIGPLDNRSALVILGLAALHLDQGRSIDAEALIREQIPQPWVDERAESSRYLARYRAALGYSLIQSGRVDEGRPLLEKAHQVFSARPQGHEDWAARTQAWWEETDR